MTSQTGTNHKSPTFSHTGTSNGQRDWKQQWHDNSRSQDNDAWDRTANTRQKGLGETTGPVEVAQSKV